MSRSDLESFLFRFDKDKALQDKYSTQSEKLFADFDLDDREQEIVRSGDVAAMFELGIHPLLIRNFAGTTGVNYVEAYRNRGLK